MTLCNRVYFIAITEIDTRKTAMNLNIFIDDLILEKISTEPRFSTCLNNAISIQVE